MRRFGEKRKSPEEETKKRSFYQRHKKGIKIGVGVLTALALAGGAGYAVSKSRGTKGTKGTKGTPAKKQKVEKS
jgi:hypothetical protein